MDVNVSRVPWSDDVSDYFADVLHENLESTKIDVQCGVSELFMVTGACDGYFCTRIDVQSDGRREINVIAGKGRGLYEVLELVKVLAKNNDIGKIRIERVLDGGEDFAFSRLVKKSGFNPVEMVYIFEVTK